MLRILVGVFVMTFLAGCDSRNVVPVSGQITLDGQPLAGIVVYFQPNDKRSNPGMGSVGTTDADGRFVLRQIQPQRDGAVIGAHQVTLRTAPAGASREDGTKKDWNPFLRLLDADLKFTVPPGGADNADFHLHSPRKQ